MSFGSFMGKTLGKMGQTAQEIMSYKAEYEQWSDRELQTEYKRLRSAGSSQEIRLRLGAVTSILKDRGYGQQ